MLTALGLAAAAAAKSTDGSPAMAVSPNWSGYVAQGPSGTPTSYTSVTGTWTVPVATCGAHSAGGISSAWVGLGGYTTSRQEEVGTDTSCDANGKPLYFAWFELVPFISYNVPPANKINAGDTMTGLVKILSISLVQLQITDQTRGWTFSRSITYGPLDTTSAEWIVESPASCLRFICHEANLTNFGALTMRNISAVGNGSTGNLSDPDWVVTPVQLIPTKLTVPTLAPEVSDTTQGQATSPAGATPGPASPDGSAFTDTWVAVANRGV